MKLIKLTANKSAFKTLCFNKTGLSLIVGGDPAHEKDRSNGVGKTLALKLVHFCLGANVDKHFKQKLKDWFFSLEFNIDGNLYRVTRTVNTPEIELNDKQLNIKEYRQWLNDAGPFHLPGKGIPISFRSLFNRFARRKREDCNDPIKLHREKEFVATINSLWLLGIDVTLANKKKNLLKKIREIKRHLKFWESDHPVINELFIVGADPKGKAADLRDEIGRLQQKLANIEVLEDYADIKAEVNLIRQETHQIETQITALDIRIENLRELLSQTPDISLNELIKLYDGLKDIFKSEALRYFEKVEEFHNVLFEQRKARLQNELAEAQDEREVLEKQRANLKQRHSEFLKILKGASSFQEYQAVANRLTNLKEQLAVIDNYLKSRDELTKKEVRLKGELQKTIEAAIDVYESIQKYIETLDSHFRRIAKIFFPRLSASLQIEPNSNDRNQNLYDIKILLEGQSSDGINDAKIIAFDWLLFTHGANHNMRMLWHDNRLFANMEPKARGNWFSFVLKELANLDKQYIISLNMENYNSLLAHISNEERELIENARILQLNGERPEDKLLGFQFDL